MNIDEAEKITNEFGKFYVNRGSLVVLEDGTTADNYEGFLPYLSVWDLPNSPGKIKHAYFVVGEYALKNEEMYSSSVPVGDVLVGGYGLLADFVENAFEINQEKQEIEQIQNDETRESAIMKFEAKYKLPFHGPDSSWLRTEFQNYLADLDGNWHSK